MTIKAAQHLEGLQSACQKSAKIRHFKQIAAGQKELAYRIDARPLLQERHEEGKEKEGEIFPA